MFIFNFEIKVSSTEKFGRIIKFGEIIKITIIPEKRKGGNMVMGDAAELITVYCTVHSKN